MRYCFGRIQGGDPVMETEVIDVKMMLIPDPGRISEPVKALLKSATEAMSQREIGHLVAVDGTGDEPSGDLAMEDRQQLDDAVLELIGVTDPAQRQSLLNELYREITHLYRSIRTAEKKMQAFRSQTAQRGRTAPRSIAGEIWEALEMKPRYQTVRDFAVTGDTEEIDLPEGKTTLIHADLWTPAGVKVGRHFIPLKHLPRAHYVKFLADDGIHGFIDVPNDPDICNEALDDYAEYKADLDEQFAELASEHTADEQLQKRVVKELWRLARNGIR